METALWSVTRELRGAFACLAEACGGAGEGGEGGAGGKGCEGGKEDDDAVVPAAALPAAALPAAALPAAALPAALVRNVRSREARRALGGAGTPGGLSVRWVEVGVADRRAATSLEAAGLFPASATAGGGAHAPHSAARNTARAAEYEEYFKPDRLSPSNNELPLAVCIALLRALRLGPARDCSS